MWCLRNFLLTCRQMDGTSHFTGSRTHLPDETKILLLDTQELTCSLCNDCAVSRQVVQNRFAKCSTHTKIAQSHRQLEKDERRKAPMKYNKAQIHILIFHKMIFLRHYYSFYCHSRGKSHKSDKECEN